MQGNTCLKLRLLILHHWQPVCTLQFSLCVAAYIREFIKKETEICTFTSGRAFEKFMTFAAAVAQQDAGMHRHVNADRCQALKL